MKTISDQSQQDARVHQYELRQWLKEKKHKQGAYGERLDDNGYAFSLLDMYNRECFICHRGGLLARHEVFFGANRDTSKATGCWVYLCDKCHKRVHLEKKLYSGETYDERLKKMMQEKFEKEYSHEDFVTLFGVNYL